MQAWTEFLAAQEQELGPETVRKWLRPLKIVHFDACNLYLEAADSFKALWFEEHIRSRVESLVNKNNRKIVVHLGVTKTGNQPKEEKEKLEKPLPFQLMFGELDPSCTFDSFIPHEGNELAHKLLTQTGSGEMELGSFNPIYVHGPEGAGKSHLLMGTAHALRERGLQVLYVRAETFTEHVVSAIRAGEMQLFRSLYRKADVLIIDGLQILGRKAATQEELFHTFNTLHVDGRQLILAASGAPHELRHIEPRLISRFEWGIVLPMELPEKGRLVDLLQRKAKEMGQNLSTDVLGYILQDFGSSPKSMMRALEAIALRAHMQGGKHKVSLAMAKSFLSDLLEEETKAQITPNRIIEAVAHHYGVQSEELLGKSQKKEASIPRQVAMYICRKKLTLSFTKIGDVFDRDHSTVMTSVRRVEEQVADTSSEVASIVHAIGKVL